uniref:Uncharacterized protein n=1 Tax=Megaselia scalaris TaxID=36166 RepID=T1GNH2_MEGSC
MCENVLQQSHLENGDNTFADPIWNCLDNPLQTRRMLKNRINSNKKLLPFEAKPKPEVYKQPKVSLGLNLQPSKNRKESRPSLEIQHKNKKPRLDFTTQINETITQSDLDLKAQSPLELDVENLSPKASEIPIKVGGCPGTPPRTPKRRSSINPLAKKAIIQNAEQYTPGKQAKTPPQSIHELDERLKSLNRKTKSILNSPLKNGPKEEEHQFLEQEAIEEQHVDQGVNEDQHLNQGVKTVSIIEVLDSSDENNEEIPDTQHPKSISEGGQLDEERGKTEEDNHESHSGK